MITVVTITFNNLAGLQKTAASLEVQDAPDFAWVVVDGASSDGSVAFLGDSARVTAFVSEPDRGIYDAMRKGLALCSTEYLVFLNAGDEFQSASSLRTVLREISNHDVYFFDTRVMSNNRSYIRRARPLSSARYSVPAVQQSTVYRASVLRGLDWPTEYKICGDYCIAAQLLAKRATSVSKNIVLSTFHLGGVSTEAFWRLCKEASEIQIRFLALPRWRVGLDFVRRLATGAVIYSVHRLQFGR